PDRGPLSLPGPEGKPALLLGERTLTFGALADRAARARAVIEGTGMGPDDRVAVMLPNGVEFFEFGLGAGAAGCSVVPVNWHLKEDEVAWLIGDSQARILVVQDGLAATARAAVAGAGADTRVLVVGEDGPDGYEGAMAGATPAPLEWRPPDYVYYTSGTTGRPRGVERAGPPPDAARVHAGLAAMWGITGDDVWMACSPLYHAANAYSYTSLSQGATVVVLERWDARRWMELVGRHRVTACFMVPSHFIRVLEVPPEERAGFDLSSLRLVLHAAAPCPERVKWQILDALPGAEVWEFYGATEGGATRISADDWRKHPGSVGRPWPGTEIRILDEAGHPCPAGETGLIYIRPSGGSRFRYRHDPDKTEGAWRDDAFTVGDIGHLDGDGYLYLTDRASDMVIRGGVNIYPAEIEAVLHRHPLVVDCAVVGVPDERLGEELRALVETRVPVSAEELADHCRRHLADFKVPRYVELVDLLPRDPSGKVVKRQLRERQG
ncbi:MAG TPA: AMP-binding protein, partial [Acidimicrobiales bacterium]|nr:AMP-binding protein [Acidimicrobiales bacterium]